MAFHAELPGKELAAAVGLNGLIQVRNIGQLSGTGKSTRVKLVIDNNSGTKATAKGNAHQVLKAPAPSIEFLSQGKSIGIIGDVDWLFEMLL